MEETHDEDWAKPGRVQRMNKDTMEHFQESVVGLSLDFTCMSNDKLNTMRQGDGTVVGWHKDSKKTARWQACGCGAQETKNLQTVIYQEE